MNLAEIRKKADGAKKAVAAAAASEPAAAFAADDQFSPEDLAGFDDAAADLEGGEADPGELLLGDDEEPWPTDELPPAPVEAFSAPALPAADDDVWLPDDLMMADVAALESEDLPVAAPELTPVEPPWTAAAPAAPVATAVAPEPAPVRSAYDALSVILSGREDAADPEEASAFRRQSLLASDVEEYLCFRVADEEYALNIMAIKEIIKPRDVTEVPRMPAFIAGVISLRGVIIPVMDMRLRLSLPVREATGRERIVVLRTAAGFCGVLVDEVVQVAKIQKGDIEPPPAVLEEIDRDFVRGLGHFDNRMLILLNLDTLIDIGIH